MRTISLYSTPRLLLAAFAFLFGALVSPASAHAEGPTGGGFLYVVQYGDTLESIAEHFGVRVEAIIQSNGMTAPYAYVGRQLYMPSRYGAAAYPKTSVYRVEPGDTLFGLARRFGVSPLTLMRVNRLYDSNFIYAGMRLLIPRAPSALPYSTYIVRHGDTLSGIALRFGASVYALMIANNIPNANLIFAGMRLVIPGARSYPTGAYPTRQPPTPGPSPTPASGTAIVPMRNLAFNPRVLTVRVGTAVVWRNDESSTIPHTVTSGAPGAPSGLFDSGTLNPGQTFQFTLNSPGTVAYYCRIHGAAMTATVTVVP